MMHTDHQPTNLATTAMLNQATEETSMVATEEQATQRQAIRHQVIQHQAMEEPVMVVQAMEVATEAAMEEVTQHLATAVPAMEDMVRLNAFQNHKLWHFVMINDFFISKFSFFYLFTI